MNLEKMCRITHWVVFIHWKLRRNSRLSQHYKAMSDVINEVMSSSASVVVVVHTQRSHTKFTCRGSAGFHFHASWSFLKWFSRCCNISASPTWKGLINWPGCPTWFKPISVKSFGTCQQLNYQRWLQSSLFLSSIYPWDMRAIFLVGSLLASLNSEFYCTAEGVKQIRETDAECNWQPTTFGGLSLFLIPSELKCSTLGQRYFFSFNEPTVGACGFQIPNQKSFLVCHYKTTLWSQFGKVARRRRRMCCVLTGGRSIPLLL